ncbi:uncharacterized protein LOC115924830 [Strongylocentrotus purpuratus]|uniref:Integrase catalytic domain-containing protein n=1 Tax=Strongylocentrotus purpuratus TaxID=7668 RepID=A0A7M7NYB5_STRPU|nr:uncharacterized protein LOC115924830 [Strongylocentrotus purpuratus]
MLDGNTTPKSPGGKDKELSNANGNDIDHVVKDKELSNASGNDIDHVDDKESGATRSFTRERDLENGKEDQDDSESTLSLCGSSASSASTAKRRERERKKERQLKAKLIALHQTSELEKKLRTLQKQHEMEQAEQEIRIAKEKAENLRKSQLLKDEEAEIERQKTAILLQAELKLLQQDSEEELQKWKVEGDSFRDRGQEREQVRGDSFRDRGQERDQVRGDSFLDRGQERERVRDDFVGDHGQERDQVRGDSFRDRGQERDQVRGDSFRDRGQERVRGDFVGGRRQEQEQAFRKEPVSNEEGATKQMLREMIRFTAENSLPSPDLEPFNGDPLDYLTFIRNFEYVVEQRTDEPFRRLELLLKYTRGEAHELIRECPHIQPSKRAYETAKSMLHRDYGKQSNIINAYKERAIAWEQIRSGDRQGLRKFAIYLNNCSHVRAAGDLGGMDSASFLRVLASKLPLYLQQKWISRVGLTRDIANRNPTLDDLAQFVIQTERNINDPMVQGLGYQRTEKNASYHKDEKEKLQKSRSTKAFGTATQQDREQKDKRDPSCTFCGTNSRHVIDECRKFEALTVEERSEQCKRKGLCFRCLKPKHLKKECKSKIKCDVCDRMHNTLMHDPRWMKDGEGNTRKTTNDASTSTDVQSEAGRISSGSTNVKKSVGGKPQTSTCMTIVPVIVKHKGNDRCISTYAFIDNGCGTVFCDTELTQRLHARTRKTKLIVKTLNLEEVIDTEVTVDELQIAGVKEKEFINLPPIYVKDGIPVTVSDAPTQKDLKRWKHLKDIELPEISNRNSISRVTLMIGANVPSASMPLEIKAGDIEEPYAIRSRLGWLVYGIQAQEQADIHKVCFCKQEEVSIIPRQEELERKFKDFCNMEFTERLSDHREGLSVDDKNFLDIMEKSITKKDNHYQMDLPLKQRDVAMPNNKDQAERFLERQGQKLSKNKEIHEQYTTFMNDLEKQGYAEKVPEADLDRHDGKVWYIPHHGVYHPQKPGKIRVVFNCPISYKGKSLNQELLQGPDLTNRLLGVLLRWRKEKVAIMADIQSMFYQVKVTPDQCDMLRYLWWPEGNITKEPVAYRMLVHLFGATSSPSCSNYALKRTAKDNEGCAKEEVLDAIQKDFYVDDFLKSVSTPREGIDLAESLRQVLSKGGFKLTKWSSNRREVLDSIPKEEHAVELKDLDLQREVLPTERALGVRWDPENDQLGFKLKEMSRKATRRNILSVMSSVYDPFGLAAPFVLKAKIILQELCQAKLDWDQSIPEKQKMEWEHWMNELQNLDQVKTERCLKPKNFGIVTNRQLHHFADASMDGYGVVTYLRQTDENEEVHVAFLTAKARVAPLKPHTIVKMELTAATLAVKQDSMIKREMNMELDETVFWTDSQTVLKYIANETARYPVFVTNRLSIIRDGSETNQWKYIPTKLNPADHASRGLDASELTKKKEWFEGPEFLKRSEEIWPSEGVKAPARMEKADDTMSGDLDETHIHATMINKEDPISALLSHYSDWDKLKRGVAWILKFKKILQGKGKGIDGNSSEMFSLTNKDIEDAEVAIVKQLQLESFPEEMKRLAGHGEEKGVPKRSTLSNLDPELSNGLLQVGGRLQNAQIPSSAKHQYILPKKHHVTTLLMQYIHRRVGHQGQNHMVAELRQKFWVVGAGVLARNIARKCIICRKNQGKAGHQKMAELPRSRVQSDEPAFTRVGMDYFGPFEIKCGRSIRKRYGVIFTCLSCRGVHIEVASSLDTSSCIEAIRRFISRRGPMKEMFSDNGTNLVGAERELKQALKELNQDQLINFHANHGMKWHFNPPAASHQGGVWERQIRTVRKILCAVMREQYLKSYQNEEQLHTFMCEVEAVINSRPLTRCSDNPNDLDVISPNSLLTMKGSTTLPPGIFDNKDIYAKKRWKQMQYLADLFWKRWVREYLPSLQRRQKWLQPSRNLQVGDIVLVIDETAHRCSWSMARVQEVMPDNKGFVRRAKVKTATTSLVRPVTKLCILLEQEI